MKLFADPCGGMLEGPPRLPTRADYLQDAVHVPPLKSPRARFMEASEDVSDTMLIQAIQDVLEIRYGPDAHRMAQLIERNADV